MLHRQCEIGFRSCSFLESSIHRVLYVIVNSNTLVSNFAHLCEGYAQVGI